jgi:CheY-like chemotaxis protein
VKVLVIEDNAVDRKLMSAVLQTDGHEALECDCAEGALEVIRSYHPDVILLDLNLPGGDGLALVRKLQEALDTGHIPIVAVTAYPLLYHGPDVLAAGCATCIIKPIDTRELVSQIRAVMVPGKVR